VVLKTVVWGEHWVQRILLNSLNQPSRLASARDREANHHRQVFALLHGKNDVLTIVDATESRNRGTRRETRLNHHEVVHTLALGIRSAYLEFDQFKTNLLDVVAELSDGQRTLRVVSRRLRVVAAGQEASIGEGNGTTLERLDTTLA
jgi:hypothetical protein